MAWTWTARKSAVSAFVLFHLAALGAWNLPASALRERIGTRFDWYMYPTGLWQEWGMFAPEPSRDTLALEALVLDSQGILRSRPFPKVEGRGPLDTYFGFRHSKFSYTVGHKNGAVFREFAARHVARNLGLPASAYPLTVQLVYQARAIPPLENPGDGPELGVPRLSVIQTYRFDEPKEALP